MIAIETKYVGPSNTRGSRIIATADTYRVTIPYPHQLPSGEACHRAAAEALKDKLGWKGRMVGGATKRGYCFVFVDGAA